MKDKIYVKKLMVITKKMETWATIMKAAEENKHAKQKYRNISSLEKTKASKIKEKNDD